MNMMMMHIIHDHDDKTTMKVMRVGSLRIMPSMPRHAREPTLAGGHGLEESSHASSVPSF